MRKFLQQQLGHDRYYALARRFYRGISFVASGSGFDCNMCGRSYRKTFFHEQLCPGCSSFPRHRLLKLYLERETGFLRDPLTMLDIAPIELLQQHALRQPKLRYLSADLGSPVAMIKIDISDMYFLRDECFDIVICYHVLEHVPDDHRAMTELFRVMKPGGVGLFQVPIKASLEKTYENPAITSPEDREEHFGQYDHVRFYGPDFKDRLEHAGFNVHLEQYAKKLEPGLVQRHGLQLNDTIYVCRKA